MNAPDRNWLAKAEARHHDVANWVRSQEHPTDCLCAEVCAPIAKPTRSPIVNDALAGKHGVDVAQGVALLVSLKPYPQKVAVGHLQALHGLQGKLG